MYKNTLERVSGQYLISILGYVHASNPCYIFSSRSRAYALKLAKVKTTDLSVDNKRNLLRNYIIVYS